MWEGKENINPMPEKSKRYSYKQIESFIVILEQQQVVG